MLKSFLSITSASLLALSFSATADWQINNSTSRVSFVSVKKNTIAENHFFKQVQGQLTSAGKLTIELPVSSVESQIPIRNERMQTMLFNAAAFPNITITADTAAVLAALETKQLATTQVSATLALHGVTKTISVDALVAKQQNGDLIVSSLSPVIINAADFGLSQGIDALQKVAGLPSIAHAVPVSFTLHFSK